MRLSKRTESGKEEPQARQVKRSSRKTPSRSREGEGEAPSKLDRIPKAAFGRIGAAVPAVAGIGGWIGRLGRSWLSKLGPPTAKLRRRLSTIVAALSRAITPTRGLLIAAIGCAVLLALSQFADYRSVEIGVDSSDAGIASLAPTPEVGRAELGSAHAYAMVPVAILVIAILAVAARTGRWQLCRLVALIGVIVVAVSLFIDRPTGLDEGAIARDFADAEATLLGGFWVQVFAGIGLIVTSLMLGAEIRRARPSGARGKDERKRGSRRKPLAGVPAARADAKGAGA
ncbi:MAG: hypothetical protein JJE23_15315 [Thermoleophilia bacterium]|nr:hypothetical protein [Thermoleophilia bacterium]